MQEKTNYQFYLIFEFLIFSSGKFNLAETVNPNNTFDKKACAKNSIAMCHIVGMMRAGLAAGVQSLCLVDSRRVASFGRGDDDDSARSPENKFSQTL